MAEQKAKPNPVTIEKHLKGIDFPAGRDDLVRHARGQGAPEEVIAVLQKMPDRQYDNAADVAKGVGQIE